MRLAVSAISVWLLFGFGCASGLESAERDTRAGRYKPGQSLEARLCECRECMDASCCGGDGEEERALDAELGMALKACGRCVRRTWTARGSDSCTSHAPSECCAGTVSDPLLAAR